MSIFHRAIIIVLGSFLLGNTELSAAESNLDRTVEKLAASMLRECPELRGEERTSVARQRLIAEFEKYKVHQISSDYHRQIKRRKVDYTGFAWTRIVALCEAGNFKDPKMQFLLQKAKDQKMRSEEHYVVAKLMSAYYTQAVERRTEESRKSLSLLGKRYTEYVRKEGQSPEDLATLQPDEAMQQGMDPLTGVREVWVYVGAGPAEIRGSNRYRVIAFSPFPTGKGLAYRWVVYKGGQLGMWRTESILDAVKDMKAESQRLAQISREKVEVIAKESPKSEPKKVNVTARKTTEPVKKAKLKITIKELW